MKHRGVVVIAQNVGEARQAYEAAMRDAITDGFRKLLAEKHIYQYVELDDEAVRRAMPPITDSVRKHCEQAGTFVRGVSDYAWVVERDEGEVRVEDGRPFAEVLRFQAPHVKMFCRDCNGREVFNNLSASSTIKIWDYPLPVIKGRGTHEQVYQLVYLCQNCRKFPEVVLVRRTGGKLRLSGRSPMEHVQVPGYIPKEISKFYAGAIMAYQSSQVLAANFMLRTAIEQWSIPFVAPGVLGGAAVEQYTGMLPDDFKQHFPSLFEIYSKLSEDIHAAKGSSELFVAMSEKFLEHFDARRVRKLSGPQA